MPAAITTTLVRDADNDTKVDAEASADEDKVRITIAGTLRYLLQSASIHHQLVGAAYLSPGPLYVGDAATGQGWLNVDKTIGNTSDANVILTQMRQSATLTGSSQFVQVVDAAPTVSAGSATSGHTVRGLQFVATLAGSGSFAEGTSIAARALLANNGAHTALKGVLIVNPFSLAFSGSIASARGLHINNQGLSSITDVYGIDLDAITAGTNRRPIWERGSDDDDADGNRFYSNTALFTLATSSLFGSGDGVLHIANARTNPSTNPSGGGILYADAGALKWRGSGGTVTTIAPA